MIDEKRIEELEKKRDSLSEKIKKAKLQNKHNKQKKSSFKKELVGRYHLEIAEAQGETGIAALKELMDKYLRLPHEREVFDLLPLDE